MGDELDNFRAALEWSVKEDPLAALRIASALKWFWRVSPELRSEGLRWLELGLDADRACSGAGDKNDPGHALTRGWALNVAGWFQRLRANYNSPIIMPERSISSQRTDAARKSIMYLQEALTLFQASGKPGQRGLSFTLRNLAPFESDPQRRKMFLQESLAISLEEGDKFSTAEVFVQSFEVAFFEKDYDLARKLAEQALALRKEIGDLEGAGYHQWRLGDLAYAQGDYGSARKWYEDSLSLYQMLGFYEWIFANNESLSLIASAQGADDLALMYAERMLAASRELGDWGYADGLTRKGHALIHADPLLASELLAEALATFRRDERPLVEAYNLEIQAHLASVQGHPERAARLFGAVMNNEDMDASLVAARDRLRETLLSALGDQAFEHLLAEGKAMTLEQAVDYALEESE